MDTADPSWIGRGAQHLAQMRDQNVQPLGEFVYIGVGHERWNRGDDLMTTRRERRDALQGPFKPVDGRGRVVLVRQSGLRQVAWSLSFTLSAA